MCNRNSSHGPILGVDAAIETQSLLFYLESSHSACSNVKSLEPSVSARAEPDSTRVL